MIINFQEILKELEYRVEHGIIDLTKEEQVTKLTQICPKFRKTLERLNIVLKTTSKKELWVSENGPEVTTVLII